LRLVCVFSFTLAVPAQDIGDHPAVYDKHGILLLRTPWGDAIQREVNWYLNCPVEHGYPRFVSLSRRSPNGLTEVGRPQRVARP